MEAPEDGCVYLGFSPDVDADTLAEWVADQGPMIEALNRLPVRAGDCVLVPAGVPHAIGPGLLVVELQEPTDYSVLLEWKGFDIADPSEWHVGLGTEVALELVDRRRGPPLGWRPCGSASRFPWHPGRGSLLPALADPFFRAEQVTDGAVLEGSVSILVVVEGSLSLSGLDRQPRRDVGAPVRLRPAADHRLGTGDPVPSAG